MGRPLRCDQNTERNRDWFAESQPPNPHRTAFTHWNRIKTKATNHWPFEMNQNQAIRQIRRTGSRKPEHKNNSSRFKSSAAVERGKRLEINSETNNQILTNPIEKFLISLLSSPSRILCIGKWAEIPTPGHRRMGKTAFKGTFPEPP